MNTRMLALIQGFILLFLGGKKLGILQGTLSFPVLSVDSVLQIYLPLVYGFGSIQTKLKLPYEQIVVILLLAYLAFVTLVQQARTDPSNFDNILEGYLPAGGAGLGLLKVFKL